MIKIALIDDDLDYCNAFSRIFSREDGADVSVFSSQEQISDMSKFKDFDIIYVDDNLNWERGERVINEISCFTDADFALIGTFSNHFTKENIDNSKISAILMKENDRYLVEWYNDTKKKRELLNK